MQIFLLTLAVVALCVVGMCANILLRKDGKFPEYEVGSNSKMKELGIKCVRQEEAEAAAAATAEAPLPDDGTLAAKWIELSAQFKAWPRLETAMANTKIQVTEADGVKVVGFQVLNESQKKWIEDRMLRGMEEGLRKLTGSRKVNIVITTEPEEEREKVPYMPEEKARDLMDKHPSVREFVAELGLDTK